MTSHGSPDTELRELQKHIKFAVLFIIGGITQIFMLAAKYKTTAISNIKVRAALAGRQKDSADIASGSISVA